MNTTDRKRRTITLTDAAPVKIYEDEWPVIASASGDNDKSGDYARHNQALAQGELDTYALRVRQHVGGFRHLVYGVVTAGYGDTEDWKGGEIVDHDGDLIAAIRRVGQRLPDRIVRECIADLPAEDI